MKIDKTTREMMKQDIKVVLFHLAEQSDISVKEIDFTIPLIHSLWFKTVCSKSYDISNPNCITKENGERLLKLNEKYELYPCNTNDTTIETALKSIFFEIKNELI